MNKKFMFRAAELAKKAYELGEIPVGAVVVKDDRIIGEGYNMRESKNSVISHAEIEAIENAAKTVSDWRLDGCSIYVTLEPCFMCAGAILNSRISEIVFGAFDLKEGCVDSKLHITDLGFKGEIYGGIMEEECVGLLKSFFKNHLR